MNGVTVFQMFFVPACALLGLRALLRTRNGGTPRLSGIVGILVWSAAAIAIAVPELTVQVAAMAGIGRGADMVFYLAILGGMSACFYFYQRCRQLENVISELVRREAIRNAQFGSQSLPGN